MNSNNQPTAETQSKIEFYFLKRYNALAAKTDYLFGCLFFFQWILGVVFSLFISPRAWGNEFSVNSTHLYLALFLGGIIAAFPIYLITKEPGATFNRFVITISQMLFSILFIHLTGGRIETHFHVFGSLAFLAIYRDSRIIILAVFLTTIDHLVRGFFWPESVYGVLSADFLRALEHAAWVFFESAIILYAIKLSLSELNSISKNQVKLEETILNIEEQVTARTRELKESNKIILEQQQNLITISKLSALGEMASGIAHEINTPLASIRNLSSQIEELIEEEPIDKPQITQMSVALIKMTDRIAKIIQSLRSFSHAESNSSFENISVRKLLDETLILCQERFKNNQIKLIIADFEDVTFKGIFVEITQVFLNILNNAYDAVLNYKEKWVKIAVVQTQKSIEIRITDSGNGIKPEFSKKLFQPFFTTKEIGKGTGLGLSVSARIIEAHHGSIFLDKNNQNTCFVLIFPRSG